MLITTFSGMISISAEETSNGLPVSDNMLSQHVLGDTILDYNFTANPDELIGTFLYLIDEKASGFVTGVCIPVDGGFSAYSGV